MDIDIHPDMLEVLLQETDLIIYQVEVGKRQIRWFGAIERLTGFPADTLKSWKADQWFSQIHPQDRSRVKETIQSAREDQIPYHLEYRFKKSSADYIWLEDMGLFHVKGEDNTRIIGTIRDISQRKTCETESQQYYSKLEEMVANRTAELQEINNRLTIEGKERLRTEQALQASEAKYRRVFENTGTATVLIEPDMTIAMANVRAAELFGHPIDKLINHFKIIDFSAPAYRDRLSLYHELLMQGDPGVPNQFEFQIIDGKGRLHDLMAQVQWIPQAGQAVASFLDMTDVKKAERERERLAAVIEQSADSIVITDMRGRIEYANRIFEKLHGVEACKAVGQTIEAPFFSKQEYRILKEMTYMVSGEDHWTGRIQSQDISGHTYIADTTILPICDRRGQAVNLVCIKKDLTREIHLEKQLQHSQKMEAIGTLAGGIAHDFNNILGGIFGFTELSLQITPKDNDRLKRNLKRIIEGCERARDLIHHILIFCRRNEDQNKAIEIQLVVKEALKLLRASIPATVTINQNIQADPCIVCTTPTHIHQILMNLCTNAAHAMEPHGGTLEINLKNIELTEDQCRSKFNTAPGAYVLLKVSDTGKGMSSDILERIFEPYFTTKAPGDGTGLGLSVVHGIVNNLHGLINVSSQVNQGTTFEIYLPRISEPVEPEIKKINKLPRGRENILVVDDEAVILEIMREMLQALGYQVYVAESGWKALESLQSNPQHIDLIVTDQVMPKMTGIQLIEAVHRLRPDLPIILCTGMQMKNKENSGINSKINKVLYKPIDYDQLAVAIREALDTKR